MSINESSYLISIFYYICLSLFPYICIYLYMSSSAAGTAVRFEPGETKTITLVDIGGDRVIRGGNGLCNGPVDPLQLPHIYNKLINQGFLDSTTPLGDSDTSINKRRKLDVNTYTKIQSDLHQRSDYSSGAPFSVPRTLYSRMYGPTTGDIVRLADTELYIRVEKDLTVYGDECELCQS